MSKIHPENIKIGQIYDLHIGKDEELVQGIGCQKKFYNSLRGDGKKKI